jgi:hypothetical protein
MAAALPGASLQGRTRPPGPYPLLLGEPGEAWSGGASGRLAASSIHRDIRLGLVEPEWRSDDAEGGGFGEAA